MQEYEKRLALVKGKLIKRRGYTIEAWYKFQGRDWAKISAEERKLVQQGFNS